MITQEHPLERPTRISGILVLAGMVIQLLTLFWIHPIAFLVFLMAGGSLIAVGVLSYLLWILKIEQSYEGKKKES